MIDTFSIISPEDSRVVATRPYHTEAQIQATLEKAQKAQQAWQQYTLDQRINILEQFIRILDDNRADIALGITQQMGRPIRFSPGEISGVIERTTKMIALSRAALSPQFYEEEGKIVRYITRVALGTVFIIAPWNYPLLTVINSLIPALLAGNTVLLKHSQSTALCAEVIIDSLQKAGLPEGVCSYLHIRGSDTEKLLGLSCVDGVVFTGSVGVGRKVERATAGQFVPAGLELGGKDAAYVRRDADISFAAESLAEGALFNSGQSCCGIERIYVHENVYDDFVEQIAASAQAFYPGKPSDSDTVMGPVINAAAAKTIQAQQQAAIDAGATPLLPDRPLDHLPNTGTYLNPQFLLGVNHDMPFMQEETFGPNAGIMPVKDDAEALTLVNDSKYGLTASIWTADMNAAQNLGTQISTGTIFMNRCDYVDPALTWGGTKDTGKGQSLGVYGFHQVTRPQSFHLRHHP